MNREVIIATGNGGKLREFIQILSGLPFTIKSLKDYWDPAPCIPENGATFYENAREKAQWVFSRKGAMSLADESGLEVDFLQGRPGVHSARFAGEPRSDRNNIEKLLSMMALCPRESRQARFKCALVLTLSSTEEITAEGVCEGSIGYGMQGSNGFGYDPVFLPDGFSTTFAQLDAPTKNAISHRGKALGRLKEKLYERFF